MGGDLSGERAGGRIKGDASAAPASHRTIAGGPAVDRDDATAGHVNDARQIQAAAGPATGIIVTVAAIGREAAVHRQCAADRKGYRAAARATLVIRWNRVAAAAAAGC